MNATSNGTQQKPADKTRIDIMTAKAAAIADRLDRILHQLGNIVGGPNEGACCEPRPNCAGSLNALDEQIDRSGPTLDDIENLMTRF